MLVNRGSCVHVNFFFEIDTQTPGTQFLMGLRFEKKKVLLHSARPPGSLCALFAPNCDAQGRTTQFY